MAVEPGGMHTHMCTCTHTITLAHIHTRTPHTYNKHTTPTTQPSGLVPTGDCITFHGCGAFIYNTHDILDDTHTHLSSHYKVVVSLTIYWVQMEDEMVATI